MSAKIRFTSDFFSDTTVTECKKAFEHTLAPRKSVVQVKFPGRDMTLAYFNDRFDLKVGDTVYVDGKLEGIPGRVTDISYSFKIRLSDYKNVIAVVDTAVHGRLYIAGTHLIAFDRDVLSSRKVALWFKSPDGEDEEYVFGSDGVGFDLYDLKAMNVSPEIAERGHKYYMENRVRYISLDGEKGYAIVEGTKPYEVEFEYRNGEIYDLVCSCYCSFRCKHEVAAILQLRETLDYIDANYRAEYEKTGYFAAICKSTVWTFAVEGQETGSVVF